ncbi:hypothetical protein DNFV4_01705 [Nitrospira tepida]|uniref:Uncharacterized protein n=1 Tax=Nitrospira tepida TaxID=2973512 RepID=A0AA86T442_9BACT|nr:DUF6733 family protein [Nitrospira tepida]CAI4031279.1 hypothetical protein DNFV4_01705 [Nitrospira tepida]
MAQAHRWRKGLLIWLMVAGGLGGGPMPVGAEDDLMDTTKHPVSVTMALQADSFFGFNPQVYGTYGLTKNLALAFNVTYWTDIQGLGVHDSNPWLELDLGVNLKFLDDRLSITPMIGTVHGQLLSSRGGAFPKGGGSRNERTTAFDGWVPNITVNYLDSRFEGEFYMGYYKAGRNEGGSPGGAGAGCVSDFPDCTTGNRGTWDFLHYWVNAGYRLNSMWSIGGHYEHLLTTRDNSAPGAQQDYYRWVGPYAEMKLAGGMALRFTVGRDLTDNQDFYKIKFTKTF